MKVIRRLGPDVTLWNRYILNVVISMMDPERTLVQIVGDSMGSSFLTKKNRRTLNKIYGQLAQCPKRAYGNADTALTSYKEIPIDEVLLELQTKGIPVKDALWLEGPWPHLRERNNALSKRIGMMIQAEKETGAFTFTLLGEVQVRPSSQGIDENTTSSKNEWKNFVIPLLPKCHVSPTKGVSVDPQEKDAYLKEIAWFLQGEDQNELLLKLTQTHIISDTSRFLCSLFLTMQACPDKGASLDGTQHAKIISAKQHRDRVRPLSFNKEFAEKLKLASPDHGALQRALGIMPQSERQSRPLADLIIDNIDKVESDRIRALYKPYIEFLKDEESPPRFIFDENLHLTCEVETTSNNSPFDLLKNLRLSHPRFWIEGKSNPELKDDIIQPYHIGALVEQIEDGFSYSSIMEIRIPSATPAAVPGRIVAPPAKMDTLLAFIPDVITVTSEKGVSGHQAAAKNFVKNLFAGAPETEFTSLQRRLTEDRYSKYFYSNATFLSKIFIMMAADKSHLPRMSQGRIKDLENKVATAGARKKTRSPSPNPIKELNISAPRPASQHKYKRFVNLEWEEAKKLAKAECIEIVGEKTGPTFKEALKLKLSGTAKEIFGPSSTLHVADVKTSRWIEPSDRAPNRKPYQKGATVCVLVKDETEVPKFMRSCTYITSGNSLCIGVSAHGIPTIRLSPLTPSAP